MHNRQTVKTSLKLRNKNNNKMWKLISIWIWSPCIITPKFLLKRHRKSHHRSKILMIIRLNKIRTIKLFKRTRPLQKLSKCHKPKKLNRNLTKPKKKCLWKRPIKLRKKLFKKRPTKLNKKTKKLRPNQIKKKAKRSKKIKKQRTKKVKLNKKSNKKKI